MKLDKFKNKSKKRFIPEKEKHGKKERRHNSRRARIKNELNSVKGNIVHFPYTEEEEEALDYEDFDDLTGLDKFEKMG